MYFVGSNILLELKCSAGCSSPFECMCPGEGGVRALLSDFDLVEKVNSDNEWEKLGDCEPDGTRGMKAPEVLMLIH